MSVQVYVAAKCARGPRAHSANWATTAVVLSTRPHPQASNPRQCYGDLQAAISEVRTRPAVHASWPNCHACADLVQNQLAALPGVRAAARPGAGGG